MKFKDFKEKLLKKARFRKEYYSQDLAFEVSNMIAKARILKGLTQERLAKLMSTKQSSIARAENGSYLPSLGFLKKMAGALDTYLIPPKFGFMEMDHTIYFRDSTQTNFEVKSDDPIAEVSQQSLSGIAFKAWKSANEINTGKVQS